VRLAEVRPLQVGAAELGVPQVAGMQVEPIAQVASCPSEVATTKHRQARLHVGSAYLQLRHLVDRRGSDVLAWEAWRPGGMAADEGGQHLPDRGPIGNGVASDALQRVDPAKPHVQLVVAELVDRPGVALGDLALPGGPELAVGEVHAHQQDHATKPLQQSRTDLVLCLQSLKRPVMHKPRGRCHQHHPQQSKNPSDPGDDR
jgi:hypothetical protein